MLVNGLEGELEDSKYDYWNKETDNSRNGYNEKTQRTSLGDLNISVTRDRKEEFGPQIAKKGDIEKNPVHVRKSGLAAEKTGVKYILNWKYSLKAEQINGQPEDFRQSFFKGAATW